MADDLRGSIAEFHRVIEGLLAAGIPVQIDGVRGRRRISQLLYQLESEIARYVSREGLTPEQLLSAISLPHDYRESLLAWLRYPDSTESLDVLTCRASASHRMATALRVVWFRIMVLLFVAVGAGWFVLNHSIPAIVSMYEQHEVPSGTALSIVQGLSEFWGITVAFVIGFFVLACAAILNWSTSWRWRWLSLFSDAPGRCLRAVENTVQSQLALHHLQLSTSADGTANENASSAGMDFPNDSETNGSEVRPQRSDAILADGPYGQRVVVVSGKHSLLNWAMQDERSVEEKSRRVHGAAVFYQRLAQFHERQFAQRLLYVLTLVVGGFAVTCIALSLFQPLCDLLLFVASDLEGVQ